MHRQWTGSSWGGSGSFLEFMFIASLNKSVTDCSHISTNRTRFPDSLISRPSETQYPNNQAKETLKSSPRRCSGNGWSNYPSNCNYLHNYILGPLNWGNPTRTKDFIINQHTMQKVFNCFLVAYPLTTLQSLTLSGLPIYSQLQLDCNFQICVSLVDFYSSLPLLPHHHSRCQPVNCWDNGQRWLLSISIQANLLSAYSSIISMKTVIQPKARTPRSLARV